MSIGRPKAIAVPGYALPPSPLLNDSALTAVEVYSNNKKAWQADICSCLLYTSPSPRDQRGSRMPSSA